jgi:serine/threonine protein kinase
MEFSAEHIIDIILLHQLGDFGLVRLGQQNNSMTMPTTTVLGTSAYMAPEAFRGDVSVKLDTFSFGVVSQPLFKNSCLKYGKVKFSIFPRFCCIPVLASLTKV